MRKKSVRAAGQGMGWFLLGNDEDKYRHAINEIPKQRDRGAAIIATSILEDHLLDAIRARIERHGATEAKVFNGYGALATFAARIDLGLLLGIYPEEGHKRLHLIRRIRNNFAHSMQPISFKSQRSDCNKLRATRSYRQMNAMLDETINKVQPLRVRLDMYRSTTNLRTQFIRAVQDLCFYLWAETLSGRAGGDWIKEKDHAARRAGSEDDDE